MSNTRVLPRGGREVELALLLTQLTEAKRQVEGLLERAEVLLGGSAVSRTSVETATFLTPARKSSLDRLKAVVESTADLRDANGKLSALSVAKVFGVSLSQLAGWMGRTKQAVSKTPDADSLQEALGYFERVARIRLVMKDDSGFRKWLRTPHDLLGDASPLEVMAHGEWQSMADYVDDLLTGSPT